jgi:hypothetical protein
MEIKLHKYLCIKLHKYYFKNKYKFRVIIACFSPSSTSYLLSIRFQHRESFRTTTANALNRSND